MIRFFINCTTGTGCRFSFFIITLVGRTCIGYRERTEVGEMPTEGSTLFSNSKIFSDSFSFLTTDLSRLERHPEENREQLF